MLRSRRTRKPVTRWDGEVAGLFLFNLGLGLCFTVLLTAPAVRFFDTHVFGYPHDGFEYMWRMWWTRKALLDLHVTPAQMSYINYPYLDYNPHLVASPLISLLAVPFVGWLGSLRTYNALLFLSFALSWPTGALLCREFTRERLSASVGGALYAFHANRVAHAIGCLEVRQVVVHPGIGIVYEGAGRAEIWSSSRLRLCRFCLRLFRRRGGLAWFAGRCRLSATRRQQQDRQ